MISVETRGHDHRRSRHCGRCASGAGTCILFEASSRLVADSLVRDGHAVVGPPWPATMPRTITDFDRWTFNEGTHIRLFEVLGAHLGDNGATFRVWAPNAAAVSVIGRFQRLGLFRSEALWPHSQVSGKAQLTESDLVTATSSTSSPRTVRAFVESRSSCGVRRDSARHGFDRVEPRLRLGMTGLGWRPVARSTRAQCADLDFRDAPRVVVPLR